MLAESRQGMPSYVTENLTQAAPALTDPEIREQQHLPPLTLLHESRPSRTPCVGKVARSENQQITTS